MLTGIILGTLRSFLFLFLNETLRSSSFGERVIAFGSCLRTPANGDGRPHGHGEQGCGPITNREYNLLQCVTTESLKECVLHPSGLTVPRSRYGYPRP